MGLFNRRRTEATVKDKPKPRKVTSFFTPLYELLAMHEDEANAIYYNAANARAQWHKARATAQKPGKLVRTCPGRMHAWFETPVGIIRKPIIAALID